VRIVSRMQGFPANLCKSGNRAQRPAQEQDK